MKKEYGMKPDAACHTGKNYHTAKKANLPGQMYVPKKVSNEAVQAAETNMVKKGNTNGK
jgi:hypothetical protein